MRPTTVIRAAAVKFFDNWGGQLSSSQTYTGTWPSLSLNQNSNQNYPNHGQSVAHDHWNNPFNAGGSWLCSIAGCHSVRASGRGLCQPNSQNAYSEQWNFGIQQVNWHQHLLEADYVGSHSSRLDLRCFR